MSNGNQKDTNANSFIIFIPIWLAVMLSCLEIGKALQTEKRMTANINETENKPATRKTEINYVVKGDVTKTRPILAIFFPGDKFVGKNGLRGSFYRYRATQNSVSLDQIATYHISRTLSATNLSSLINESQADEGGFRSCSQSNTVACHSYVRSWTYFYLKIGGWVTLGIVLTGITFLAITHILGTRKIKRAENRTHMTNIKWSEARRRSKLARWV